MAGAYIIHSSYGLRIGTNLSFFSLYQQACHFHFLPIINIASTLLQSSLDSCSPTLLLSSTLLL